MRIWGTVIGFVVLALIGGLFYAFATGIISVGVHTSVCRENEEIDKTLRDEASKAALAFADALLKPDASPAYQQLTSEFKSIHKQAEFVANVKTIQSQGQFSGVKIDHLYEPSVRGRRSVRALCGQISSAEHWVSVEAKPGVTQIHAVVLAQTQNNDWAFTLWLIKETGAWRVQSYYESVASMAGHFPPEILANARAQEKKGHAFNAYMLYVALNALVDRGPAFQLGLKQEVDGDIARHKRPPEIAGDPPYTWRLDGKDYRVEYMTILGIEKQLELILLYRDSEWDGKDMADAERRNRRFLEAFIKLHPEYSESFGVLLARVLPMRGESGWGTVFKAETGYLEDDKRK